MSTVDMLDLPVFSEVKALNMWRVSCYTEHRALAIGND